jgi:predicted O-linked N-acetylglucosamine transferase (SPINDLY family)
MVQRYAKGLYARMGIGDLIVSNEDEYVELAAHLGRDTDFRRAMCDQIRERSDVLFEDRAAVFEYERFFERIVEQ